MPGIVRGLGYGWAMSTHATAVVDEAAELAPDVEVGPYTVVGAGVRIGAGTRIGPHSCLEGPLEIGEQNEIGFSAAIGLGPQIAGSRGPFGAARIGDRNVFREFTQVHRSREPDGVTLIGDDNYFMAGAHVAHDCDVGCGVVLCNNVLLAGHVTVGDKAFFAGRAGIHQFARVGELAMLGGAAGPVQDIPPYCTAIGVRPCVLTGLNVVGLRRAGVGAEERRALKAAYRTLFRSNLPLDERIGRVDATTPEVAKLVDFLRTSERGVTGFHPFPDRSRD